MMQSAVSSVIIPDFGGSHGRSTSEKTGRYRDLFRQVRRAFEGIEGKSEADRRGIIGEEQCSKKKHLQLGIGDKVTVYRKPSSARKGVGCENKDTASERINFPFLKKYLLNRAFCLLTFAQSYIILSSVTFSTEVQKKFQIHPVKRPAFAF